MYNRYEEKKYLRHIAKDPNNNPEGHRQRKAQDKAQQEYHKKMWNQMLCPTEEQRRVAEYVEGQLGMEPHTLQYIYPQNGGPFMSQTFHYTDGEHVYSSRCECRPCTIRGQGTLKCEVLCKKRNEKAMGRLLTIATDDYFIWTREEENHEEEHKGRNKKLHYVHWLSNHCYFG